MYIKKAKYLVFMYFKRATSILILVHMGERNKMTIVRHQFNMAEIILLVQNGEFSPSLYALLFPYTGCLFVGKF